MALQLSQKPISVRTFREPAVSHAGTHPIFGTVEDLSAASGRPGVICGRKPVPDGAGEDKARFGCAGDDGSLNGEKSSAA